MQASASALGALRKTTWLGLAAVTDNTRTKPKPEQHARQTQSAAAFHTRLFACTASRDCSPTMKPALSTLNHVTHALCSAYERWYRGRYDGRVLHVELLRKKIPVLQKLVIYLPWLLYPPFFSSVQRIEQLLRISYRQSWDYDPTKSTCKCWSSPKVSTAWSGTNAGSYSTLREAREACESQPGCGGISNKQAKYYTWRSYKKRPGYFPGWTSWYYNVDSCASESLS